MSQIKASPARRDYYGHYSPASSGISRGKRKKNDQDKLIPSILESEGSSKERRKNRARLIQKIVTVHTPPFYKLIFTYT